MFLTRSSYLVVILCINTDLGMGLRVRKKSPVLQTENGVSPGDSSGIDEEGEEDEVKLYARAVYAFNGTNDDEVGFNYQVSSGCGLDSALWGACGCRYH